MTRITFFSQIPTTLTTSTTGISHLIHFVFFFFWVFCPPKKKKKFIIEGHYPLVEQKTLKRSARAEIFYHFGGRNLKKLCNWTVGWQSPLLLYHRQICYRFILPWVLLESVRAVLWVSIIISRPQMGGWWSTVALLLIWVRLKTPWMEGNSAWVSCFLNRW